ncbi:hypothetical protein [Siminovitchia sp. 179-K 8D1 HS]|uniref:hypothetical protein n=1 Tax=Siminovitchia sp. 179-K 8D1 HS TaxID=3142385 RepID=UPI0039A30435
MKMKKAGSGTFRKPAFFAKKALAKKIFLQKKFFCSSPDGQDVLVPPAPQNVAT